MGSEIRIGKISSIDHAGGMVRVAYHEKDDSVTRMLPLLSNEYNMPAVGDQVVVLHLSNGSEAGVVIGRPWSLKNRPVEGVAGLYRKEYGQIPGEAYISYKDGTLTIKAEKLIVEGDLKVTGELEVSGSIFSAESG